MKKVFLLFCIACLSLLCACGSKPAANPPNLLRADDARLGESMQWFFQTAGIASFEGEFFAAKLLACKRIVIDDIDYYYYDIIVAPRTDLPLGKVVIQLYPTGTAKAYYQSLGSVQAWMGDQGDTYASAPMEAVDKFCAFQLIFLWDNVNNSVFSQTCGDFPSFDTAMKSIDLSVKYADKEEALSLTLDGDIELLATEDARFIANPIMAKLLDHTVQGYRGIFHMRLPY